MPHSATILQELQDLGSALDPNQRRETYRVPQGYFENLAFNVLQRIKALEADTASEELELLSPLLAGISRQTPYQVPSGYFESLDPSFAAVDDVNAGEELQQLSPLLGGLSKKAPFSLPEGYFEQSLHTAPAASEPKAPVIRMAPRKWFRYAAAASVTAIVAISALLFWKQRSPASSASNQPYAWVEKNLKKVSTEEITRFVELADETRPDIARVDAPAELKNLLKNVSDKEIQDFLNDIPVDEFDEDDVLLN